MRSEAFRQNEWYRYSYPGSRGLLVPLVRSKVFQKTLNFPFTSQEQCDILYLTQRNKGFLKEFPGRIHIMSRQNVKKPISEVQITNPYPVGSIKYKEFERDIKKLKYTDKLVEIDEFGNRIIYKTSGFQRAVIILLILTFLAICAS